MAGIVVLPDVIAPNSLWDSGVTGRQIRRNRRAENQAGFLNINVIWSNTRREFTFGNVPHTIETWKTLEGLYEVTDAGAYGFLLIDPKDPRATHETGRVSLLSSTPTYQLLERFTFPGSSQERFRTIKYVNQSSFEVKINGVVQTVNVDYTGNPFTGVLQILTSDPDPEDITWSGIIYTPVHFQSDEIEWELVVAGSEDQRYVRGPRVVLQEVKVAL